MEKESNRAQSGRKRKATGTPLRQVERKLIQENMEKPSKTRERSVISFPMEAAEEDTIFLKLKKLNTQSMYYRLSSKMPMHTLFLDYCFRMGLLYEETKFAYNNSRVLESHTAGELKMSSGQVHTIFVFSSREEPFIDLRSPSPGLSCEKDPSMFLTLKPFGNGGDTCYSYKYSRCQPLNRLMVDYCQRRGFSAQNVCFFYSSDSSKEEIDTPKGAKVEKHDVIYVLPAAESASSSSPNTLQMNDCDVLSTTCFDMSKRGESNGVAAAEKDAKSLDTSQEEDREDVCLLTVKVVSVIGKVCYYKVNRDTPLCWVLLHYRDLKGFHHDHHRVRFVSEKDGKSLSIDDAIAKTPKEVKRDNQYVIRAIPCK